MSGGTDAELSQSTSPPSLSQVFSGITNTAPRQHAATSCELSRNDSIASMQSVESSCAEQIPDTDQATETPNEEAVAGPGDGIRVPKRLRTETEHPSLRMAIAATSTANREAESSAQARSRRPGIAQERQSRFFASSESLQRTESEGASAATSDGQDDDSDDFAQPAAPLPPPLPQSRLRPQLPQASHQIVGQQQEADDVDDRNTCSVCLDPWSISGPHRVVSLKCGHLFGQSCAKKWLRRASQKRARQAGATSGSKIVGKCPECNQRAEWKDIRPIYARSIVAIDSTQMDELRSQLRELRDAKLKLEDEHRQFCTKYSEMRNEVARMRRELERSFEKCQWLQLQNANLLKQIGTPNRHASVATGDELSDDLLADSAADSAIDTEHLVEPAYLPCMRLRATIPMTSQKSESLRLLAVHPHEPLLFASYSKPSLRLHTLAQIDVHSASSRAFLLDLPHKQEIRGAKISPHAAGTRFLLTASLDQTAAISSLGSSPATATTAGSSYAATKRSAPMLAALLKVNAPCWSCAWDAVDPNLCYIGTTCSRVLAFDLRRADAPVHTWDGPRDCAMGLDAVAGSSRKQVALGYSPIHGIVALPGSKHGGRLLVANSNGLFALPSRLEQEPHCSGSWTPVASTSGSSSRSCYSLSYDAQVDCVAASFRSQDPVTRMAATEHELYDVDLDSGNWQRRRPCISVVSPQTKMAHTAVFSYETGSHRQGLFAAGVEATRMVKLWDANGDGDGEMLALSDAAAFEDIVDVSGWQWGHDHAMFASLSNTTARLYDIR